MSNPPLPRIFTIQAYGGSPALYTVIITPEPTDPKVVTAAWSFAVRYTAKGLDLPDHDAAIKLMMQRHPSWKLINSVVQSVSVELKRAEEDIPESQ